MSPESSLRRARRGLYSTLLVTVALAMAIAALLLRPIDNQLASARLGAETRSPEGHPLVLDQPAPILPPR